jgi:hypothetical protein
MKSKKNLYFRPVIASDIPNECLVCRTEITNNSVLFHCECIVVICQACATLQISAQKSTYVEGLRCPYCRKSSQNIHNVEKIKAEENALIDEAFNHFKLRSSRSNDGIRKVILLMISNGIKGTLTAEDLNSEDAKSPEMLPALKLELARLEFVRKMRSLNQKSTESSDGPLLPLGPLQDVYFTRNTILEFVLERMTTIHSTSSQEPSSTRALSPTTITMNQSCQTQSPSIDPSSEDFRQSEIRKRGRPIKYPSSGMKFQQK